MTREEADARIAAAKEARARRGCEAIPLPDPAATILGVKAHAGTFYAATDGGAFVLDRPTMRWEKIEAIPPAAKDI